MDRRVSFPAWLRRAGVLLMLGATLGAGAASPEPLRLATPLPGATEAQAALALAPGAALRLSRVPVGEERLEVLLSRQAPEPGLQITLQDGDGARRLAPEPRAHFGGQVEGEPQSQAFAIVEASGTVQLILHRGGRSHVVRLQPPGQARAATVQSREVDPAVDFAGRRFSCQASDPAMLARAGREAALDLHARLQQTLLQDASGARSSPRSRRRADLIVETNHAFFQRFDGATQAGNYVRDLVAYISTIYQNEANTRLNLTDVRLYPAPNDPWTATTSGTLLDQLQARWNQPDRINLPRHHVHLLLTGVDQGGIATLNSLGDRSQGYGVTTGVIGALDPTSPLLISDALIMAHEIGHAFGSEHTHAFDAPLVGSAAGGAIDCCNADSAGGQCGLLNGGSGRTGPLPGPGSLTGGTPGGRNGTIMSYCHLTPDNQGNANIAPNFGTNHPHGVNPGRIPQLLTAAATTFLPLDEVAGSVVLTVLRNGSGLGSVASTPAGIACGATCSAAFAQGGTVSLAATPAAGSVFAGWGGACTGQGACSVPLAQASSVTATFNSAGAGSEAAKLQMQRVFVAYYGRPADPGGRAFWAGELDKAGGSLAAVIQSFGNSAEFTARYGGQSNEDLISLIFLQLFNRLPDAGGLAFYVGELSSGRRSLQTITLDVLGGATTGVDAERVANKVEAAAYFTAKVEAGCAYGSIDEAVNYLLRVRETVGSVSAAKAALDTRCGF